MIFALHLHSVLASEKPHQASYYQKLENKIVQCLLCPRQCVISDKQRGFCGVRENQGGELYTLVYGKPCSLHLDPIEKKPLFHVLPGARTFSLATVGCNLKCKFCQNWQISQASVEDVAVLSLSPEQVVEKARESGAPVIAYTYTEPTVFYEYMFDIARLARKAGLKNVMHSAGFINEEPLRKLCPYLDAANIDLKGFSEKFYSQMTLGRLEDVLRTLEILKSEGVWVEVTNLLIPGVNDSPEEIRKLSRWIATRLGPETPLHFSRFWPLHKLLHLSPTPVSALRMAKKIAQEEGLMYVYIGNVPGTEDEDTLCPRCQAKVVDRASYVITSLHVVEGKCGHCGAPLEGIWE
ncbi:MAG: AmmeMemoRadiSam system radical SAM enzyme [Candidatus Omnitrophota bacterium]